MKPSAPVSFAPVSIPSVFDPDHPVRTTLRLLRPHWARTMFAFMAFVIKDSPVWLLPLITANIVDVVVNGGPVASLWTNAALAAVLLLQNVPMHMLWVRLSSRVIRQVGTELRSRLAEHLQQLSIGFHTRTGASTLQTKVVRDVEQVELMLQQVAQAGTSAVFTLAGALTLTAIRVPEFVPVFLLAVPCSAGLILLFRRTSNERNEQFRRGVEQLNARVGEMAQLMPITRAHALEATAVGRVVDSVRAVGTAGLRLDMVNGRLGALSWVTYQLLGAACLVGAAAASLSNVLDITAGDIILLSSYFALLTSAITMLFGLAPAMTKGIESVRSVGEVLVAPDVERNEGKAQVASVEGAIDLRGVTFTFPGADASALRDVNLTVAPGETVALVGPSGAGKSTMLNLVLGFVRPDHGAVLLDGLDMDDIDLRSYRRYLAVVPQESLFFDGSVRDNVTYGLPGVDDEAVTTALRDANALDFVRELPHGWDTLVGDRGARLSGGQRQRLAIARALIRDPRILLLDEATSALDGESESLVQSALARLMRGRTTIVVAHRLSTIRTADRVAVLDHGAIVEIGQPADLIASGGIYARLYAAQVA